MSLLLETTSLHLIPLWLHPSFQTISYSGHCCSSQWIQSWRQLASSENRNLSFPAPGTSSATVAEEAWWNHSATMTHTQILKYKWIVPLTKDNPWPVCGTGDRMNTLLFCLLQCRRCIVHGSSECLQRDQVLVAHLSYQPNNASLTLALSLSLCHSSKFPAPIPKLSGCKCLS